MIDDDGLYRVAGRTIRDRRLACHLTQDAVAARLGMLRSSVANIEAGRQRAPLHVYYALCVLLRIAPRDLFPPVEAVTGQGSLPMWL